jgi:hypothetical protein
MIFDSVFMKSWKHLKEEGWLSRFCDAYLIFIISLNVVAVIMESVASI